MANLLSNLLAFCGTSNSQSIPKWTVISLIDSRSEQSYLSLTPEVNSHISHWLQKWTVISLIDSRGEQSYLSLTPLSEHGYELTAVVFDSTLDVFISTTLAKISPWSDEISWNVLNIWRIFFPWKTFHEMTMKFHEILFRRGTAVCERFVQSTWIVSWLTTTWLDQGVVDGWQVVASSVAVQARSLCYYDTCYLTWICKEMSTGFY
jgi:hypothetical protein